MLCVLGPPRSAAAPTRSPLEADLVRIEDDLIAAFGARWDDPPILPETWPSMPHVADLRDHTAARLREANGTHVVRSEPRSALFLPFWDAVATVDGAALVLVSPDDAVHHLSEDEALDVEGAAQLWLRYVVCGWLGAPHREIVQVSELRENSHAVVRRLVGVGDGGYDPDEVRHALATAAGGVSDRNPAPAPTVGHVIGGPTLALARSVYHVITEDDDEHARPLLEAIAGRWIAQAQAAAVKKRADAASRVAQEQGLLADRHALEKHRAKEALKASDRRWGRTTRAAIVAEGKAMAHLRSEVARIRDEQTELQSRLEELHRDYNRLRGRRLVRVALSAAELAKPLFRVVRGARKRQQETATGTEAAAGARRSARVFAVVLNYKHVDDTLTCLDALRASDDRHLFPVVVDNGSGQEAVSRLRREVGARPLIDAGDNLGYASGNNLGIQYALDRGAEFVWILNPDARVESDTLSRLLTTMRDNPDAGVVGARILNGGSDPVTIASDGGVVDWDEAAAADHLNVGARDDRTPAGPPHPVDYVPGACMLVRRSLFEDIGLLPEEYFLYFEETDFNLRARDAGWRVLVDPQARVWHHKRSSGRVPAPYYVYYYVRNRQQFTLRHVDGWDPEKAPPDLEYWMTAWHDKVERAAPEWLGTFEELVDIALADARAGVTGRRKDIEDIPAADEAPRTRPGAPTVVDGEPGVPGESDGDAVVRAESDGGQEAPAGSDAESEVRGESDAESEVRGESDGEPDEPAAAETERASRSDPDAEVVVETEDEPATVADLDPDTIGSVRVIEPGEGGADDGDGGEERRA